MSTATLASAIAVPESQTANTVKFKKLFLYLAKLVHRHIAKAAANGRERKRSRHDQEEKQ